MAMLAADQQGWSPREGALLSIASTFALGRNWSALLRRPIKLRRCRFGPMLLSVPVLRIHASEKSPCKRRSAEPGQFDVQLGLVYSFGIRHNRRTRSERDDKPDHR